jgi:hypothetical protein
LPKISTSCDEKRAYVKKDKMNVGSLIGDAGICIRYLSPKFNLAFIFKILKLYIEKASIWGFS